MLNPQDTNNAFIMSFMGAVPGTFDIFLTSITSGGKALTGSGGRAKATVLTYSTTLKGTVTGTFNTTVMDESFASHTVKGSFNLKQ
ncbi:hypothetical protein GCM10022210_32820 [Mucilaginibacter dorajii]|uniref:Dirigent protein n=2 Tax=Mucilaginibacter dorajii TaxID=692994 RepID=A0ABP7QA99_9SPHI